MVFFLGFETVPFKVKLLYKVLLRLMSTILMETNQNLKVGNLEKLLDQMEEKPGFPIVSRHPCVMDM